MTGKKTKLEYIRTAENIAKITLAYLFAVAIADTILLPKTLKGAGIVIWGLVLVPLWAPLVILYIFFLNIVKAKRKQLEKEREQGDST